MEGCPVLISGPASVCPSARSEIFIQFRQVPHSIFEDRGAIVQPNKLVIRLQPEENVSLLVMAKELGLDRDGIRLREVPLDLLADQRLRRARLASIAYERLLLDLIEGDPTLFVRRDDVEAPMGVDRREFATAEH
mgnify:CR=1 FL=1